jgi:hypothetical protein
MEVRRNGPDNEANRDRSPPPGKDSETQNMFREHVCVRARARARVCVCVCV